MAQSFGETLGFDEVILLLEWRRLISLAVVVCFGQCVSSSMVCLVWFPLDSRLDIIVS